MMLRPVDRLEVTILVDNTISTPIGEGRGDVKSARNWSSNEDGALYLWAAHGFSALIELWIEGESHKVLYDTGQSNELLEHNSIALGIDISDITSVIISHGHWDHGAGIRWVLQNAGSGNVSYYGHPRTLMEKSVWDGKKRRIFPSALSMNQQELDLLSKSIHLVTEPTLLEDDTLLLTGEIARTTSYEKGFKGHQVLEKGQWIEDSAVIEDMPIVAGVKDKGIVIVSGCSHAGIINIVRSAVNLTKETRIGGVIGGLHLVGENVQIIPQTVEDLKKHEPAMIVPCHCTGWMGQMAIAEHLPDAFVQGSVGTKYIFGA